MAVGRISGPLLKANLLRQGVDLAFETDLVYLKVTDTDSANHRVGIKTNDPTHTLTVNGQTHTTSLLVDDLAEIANISISGTTVSTSQDTLTLSPSGASPVVYQAKLRVDQIDIENNDISTNTLNTNLELRPNGTGTVEIYANTTVHGDIHATGDIRADGNIQIGDANTDNITFNADISSDIIPDTTNLYNLGSTDQRWLNVWTQDLFAAGIVTTDLTVDGVTLNTRQGKTIYVATNGSDTYSGTHQNDPFASVKHALSTAVAGDEVYIFAGTYTEIFPITIPVGVTIKGAGIRAVTIQPTVGTIDKDAFLLNGETTVEDLTITGYRFNSVDNTGYAFRFAANYTVTTKSPYIRNVTVITRGSVTSALDPYGFDQNDAGKGVFLDGSIATASSNEAACLFHSVTFIVPNQEVVVATNGVRIEWLNSFTYFADKGMYLYSGSTGFAGVGKTELRLQTTTGTFLVGDTVTYYSTYPTVLASGTIAKKDTDGKLYLTGKVTGLETQFERGGKPIQAFGTAQLDTAVKKFGTASLQLTGPSDYGFVQSNADFGFGTGDFTIEFWLNRDNVSAVEGFIDLRTVNPQSTSFVYANGSSLYYYVNGANVITAAAATASNNTWYHIAISRDAGSTRMFVDGTQVGSTWTDATDYIASSVVIGNNYTHNAGLTGHIDDLRITKGLSRYNSNFAAPTSAVSNDSNTVLLSRFDGTDTSTVFVDETFLIQDIRSSSGGTATGITLVDYSDFGAEVRSIGSASVYGNYGVYGDGLGVVAYLVGQNLAYIGVGKRTDNDDTYVIQDNEITELNGAKIYYSSVDHKGDYRVGDLFYVNQQDGTVQFTTANFNINSLNGVTFTNGSNTTTVDGTKVETGNIRISGNTIESLSGAVNILAASDQINLQNNVNITGNLDVTGNVTIGGNITLGDQDTDTINFVAGITSDIVPRTTETYGLGTSLLQWANLYTGNLHVDSINVNNNVISTVTTDTNLELSANGTGTIYVPTSNTVIDNDLTVNGNTTLANTFVVGTLTHTGDVTHTGNVTQTGDYTVTGTLDVGSTAQFADIKIDNNTITTTIGNNDLRLLANGTGRIYVPSDNVQIDQGLTVVGTINAGTVNSSATITANQFTTGDILVDNNFIETTLTDSNLELRANGSGVIRIEQFDFNSNIISSNASTDIVLQPGTGKVVTITSTQSIVIPVGITSERPLVPTAGMMRFNTELSRYEGYDGVDWIRLDSRVVDLDENTYITAELTPGANDNTIRFYNNGGLTADLTSTRLSAPRIEVDNIAIDSNTISTVTTDTDLIFNATGTGSVKLANFAFKDNVITNTVANAITTITQTGDGYFKIAGTNGFVVPNGNSSARPAYAVTGMTRYNSEVKQLEIFNGSSWESAAGSSGAINAATATDIAIETVLMLG